MESFFLHIRHLVDVGVMPVIHTAGNALRMCHIRRSHDRRCFTYMLHPSLTRQAVRYVYVTPVTHRAGGALHICHTHQSRTSLRYHWFSASTHSRYIYVTPITHAPRRGTTGSAPPPTPVTYMSHPSVTHLAAVPLVQRLHPLPHVVVNGPLFACECDENTVVLLVLTTQQLCSQLLRTFVRITV
jgi:hypothetical protein